MFPDIADGLVGVGLITQSEDNPGFLTLDKGYNDMSKFLNRQDHQRSFLFKRYCNFPFARSSISIRTWNFLSSDPDQCSLLEKEITSSIKYSESEYRADQRIEPICNPFCKNRNHKGYPIGGVSLSKSRMSNLCV